MPQSASTAAGAPASSSSPPTSSHGSTSKVLAASRSSTKSSPAAISTASASKKPLPVKAATPIAVHRGPVALKPSTRKVAPQNASSPAAVAVASVSTSQHSTPQPQQPADVMTMSAVISPAPTPEGPIMSMTTKEWVIPPRPKPGRKPATDTPPTKRKAQNRAAQRAFRERRAARVGELEEQLDQQKSENDQRMATYKDTIRDLELEVQSFRSRCLLLENMLERERKERLQAETMLETMRRQSDARPVLRTASLPDPAYQSSYTSGQSHPQTQQRHTRHSIPEPSSQGSNTLPPITNTPGASAPNQGYFDTDANLTCGNCEPSGRCACVEEVLNAGCGNCGSGASCKCAEEADAVLNQAPVLKRSASPTGIHPSQKRARSSIEADSPVEVDFTNMFQRRPTIETSQPSQFDSSSTMDGPPSDNTFLKDDCGFCKDGTYCVCADTAMATPAMTPVDTLPPISSQTRTPPPSETDVGVQPPFIMEMTAEGAVKLPKRIPKKPVTKPSSGGCGSGAPGTCDQCRADPKSGLFCRLMAANFSKGEGGGCCGGKGAGGGCCKSKPATSTAASSAPAAPAKEKITLPSLPSLGLSCAEAYQTLASHRNFDRAADDIGSWLPKLKTTTAAGRALAPAKGGRMGPIEVEAASIMSVLKDFDVRFGREA